MPTTSDVLIDSLKDWGVDTIFGIPGDGINGVIEAIRKRKDVKFVLTRHEQSAAFMACAYSKYTKKLGVCLSTTGPGATNLLTGLYDAKLDNTPVIAITGSTYSDLIGSDYQQDVDVLQVFSDVSEYNNRINKPEHAKMVVDRACRIALSRRGVGHITIPIDVQSLENKGNYSPHKSPGHTTHIRPSHTPSKREIEKAAKILNVENKVVILVGQGAIGSRTEVERLAKKLKAPIVKALLGKEVVPDDSRYSLGGLGMLGTEPASNAMKEADTLLMIGTSFPYHEYLPEPRNAKGIQIDINPEKIGLRYPVEIGLIGDSNLTLKKLLPLIKPKKNGKFLKKLQIDMKEWKKLLDVRSSKKGKNVKPQVFASTLSELIDDDCIVSVDSGTVTTWAARYLNLRKNMKFSVSGTLASMACAIPYGIAAQIAFPKRQSIVFVGDGGFTMSASEFATAIKYQLPIKVFVIKNNSLGMIRWEQMAFSGNPEYGVEFEPIDFAKFAEVFGARGFTINSEKKMKEKIKQSLVHDGPVIVQVDVDEYEPPIPPEVNLDYAKNMAKSFVKGQPKLFSIGTKLLSKQIKEKISKKLE